MVTDILFLLAAASSLGLGALAVARRPRGMLRWSFALGMAGFALESAAFSSPLSLKSKA